MVGNLVLAPWHIRWKNWSCSKNGYAKEPTHVPTFWPPPAQVRACHLLLESPQQARVGRPRRGEFTCHQMRAHVVSWAMGNHLACAWRAGGEPGQTPQGSCLPSFPVPCPGTSRCWTALLGSACGVPTGRSAHDGLSSSFPCTGRPCTGKTKGGRPAQRIILQGRTAGSGCRHRAQGRGKTSISLVGPACPVRASRRSTSLCFHSKRAELGQSGQGSSRSPAWGQGRKPAALRDVDQLEHRQASCCPCGFCV